MQIEKNPFNVESVCFDIVKYILTMPTLPRNADIKNIINSKSAQRIVLACGVIFFGIIFVKYPLFSIGALSCGVLSKHLYDHCKNFQDSESDYDLGVLPNGCNRSDLKEKDSDDEYSVSDESELDVKDDVHQGSLSDFILDEGVVAIPPTEMRRRVYADSGKSKADVLSKNQDNISADSERSDAAGADHQPRKSKPVFVGEIPTSSLTPKILHDLNPMPHTRDNQSGSRIPIANSKSLPADLANDPDRNSSIVVMTRSQSSHNLIKDEKVNLNKTI